MGYMENTSRGYYTARIISRKLQPCGGEMPGPDLTVLGGGPAGYVPAMRAARSGMSVVLVEEAQLGGTCLNRGCIPTKTLVATAELLRQSRAAARLGLTGSLQLDYPAAARRRDSVVARLRKGVEAGLKQAGVEVVQATGRLLGPGAVMAGDREIRSRFVLLAPGSVPAMPGPFRSGGFEDSDDALAWGTLPGSLLIVGGGVIGCEFAAIFSAFGVPVTIVEMLPSILPGIDADLSSLVHASLTKSGVRVLTGVTASSAERSDSGCRLSLADGQVLEAGHMLVATGRRPRLDGMGLAEAGIALGPGGIVVDEYLRTSLPGVYAAGDATGKWQLAHAGSAQGICAVRSMSGAGGAPVNPDAMPACVFTFPELATVGPGEEEWRSRGIPVRASQSRYIANGRAVGMNETEGFVKLIARESDGVLVAARIAGRDASSLIGEAVLAISAGVAASDLASAIHPHPTLSELVQEAAEGFEGGAIHA